MKRSTERDDGVAAVEFALVLPILIGLLFGMINFGAFFAQNLALNHAVREAARAAVVQSTGSALDIKEEVQANATSFLLFTGDVEVGYYETNADNERVFKADASSLSCDKSGYGYGKDLTVSAEYDGAYLVPWPWPGLDQTYTVRSEATFRCEWGAAS